jgi:hypothetical protein
MLLSPREFMKMTGKTLRTRRSQRSLSLAGSNSIFLLLTTLQVCVLNGRIKINRVSVYIIKCAQVL